MEMFNWRQINMKKSKLSSKRRDRSRSRSDDSKSKRPKVRSKSREKDKSKQNTKTAPRKTRWQTDDKKESSKKVSSEKAQISEPTIKKEKSGPPPRIKDMLHSKEKIVDLLFQTVTGTALQELIPDYLKKRSNEELKKLCLEQIKSMSDEQILEIISGKLESSNKDEEKQVEKELKTEQPNPSKENVEEKVDSNAEKKIKENSSLGTVDQALSNKELKPQTSNIAEKTTVGKAENQIPLVIKDEVAKDLILPERDAELLELEMRARAIRSLLKAKSESTNEKDVTAKENKQQYKKI